MYQLYDRKIKQPLLQVLKAGVSAEKIALSVACGVAGGVFPIPGLTTLPVLCFVYLFKLNPVASLTVNYLVTPLNIASFPTFIYYGNEYLGNPENTQSFSPSVLMEDMRNKPLDTIQRFQFLLLNGIIAWIVFVPLAISLCYFASLPIFHQIIKLNKQEEQHIKEKKAK